MNKGEIISTELDKQGFKKSRICESLGISRSTLDRRLSEVNPPIDFLSDITRITNIDFFELTKTKKPYNYIELQENLKASEEETKYDSNYKELYYRKCEEFDNLMDIHTKMVSFLNNKEKNVATELDAFAQHYIELSAAQTKAIADGLVNISRQLEALKK